MLDNLDGSATGSSRLVCLECIDSRGLLAQLRVVVPECNKVLKFAGGGLSACRLVALENLVCDMY